MSNNTPMGTGANGPILKRHYADSHPYQWVREVIVNSIQAEATEIRFGTEWEAVRSLGVHRRVVIDNGHGIAREDLPRFLNTFGGSGKQVGATYGNYGVGLKTSALPWNTHGLVVISRRDGDTSMLWLDHNAVTDEFGARMFDVDDQSGVLQATVPLDEMVNEDGDPEFIEDGVDWTKVFPKDQQSGTAVVFLGNSPTEHTINGDPNRDEWSKYGIARFINRTFMDLGDVLVWVEQYETASDDPDEWPKSPESLIQGRHPRGVVDSIVTGLTPTSDKTRRPEHGVIEVPATETTVAAQIHWWFSADGMEKKWSQGHKPAMPFTATAFSSHDGITETFSKGDPQIAPWKFVKPAEVHKRLAVIITPVTGNGHEIFPNATRTELKVESKVNPNAPLPYEQWLAVWHEQMPEVVREALDDYYDSGDTDAALSEEDRKRLADRFLKYFRSTVRKPAPHRDGDLTSPSGNTRPVRKRHRRRVRKTPDSNPAPTNSHTSATGPDDTSARERKTRAGMVEVSVKSLPEHPWAVEYDSQLHCAVINSDSSVYKTTMSAILDEQTAKRGSLTEGQEKAIREAVERAMRTVACVSISHAVGIAVQEDDSRVREQMLADSALSTCLYGIAPVRDMSSGFIGYAIGEAKKRSRKAAAA